MVFTKVETFSGQFFLLQALTIGRVLFRDGMLIKTATLHLKFRNSPLDDQAKTKLVETELGKSGVIRSLNSRSEVFSDLFVVVSLLAGMAGPSSWANLLAAGLSSQEQWVMVGGFAWLCTCHILLQNVIDRVVKRVRVHWGLSPVAPPAIVAEQRILTGNTEYQATMMAVFFFTAFYYSTPASYLTKGAC
jgi:hypothetical protein